MTGINKLTDNDVSYDTGYREGESSAFSDWHFALTEEADVPEDAAASPMAAAAYIKALTQRAETAEAALRVAEVALTRIGDMTDIEADFDGFEARAIARDALAAIRARSSHAGGADR